mgnify:CR=1 FL=1
METPRPLVTNRQTALGKTYRQIMHSLYDDTAFGSHMRYVLLLVVLYNSCQNLLIRQLLLMILFIKLEHLVNDLPFL